MASLSSSPPEEYGNFSYPSSSGLTRRSGPHDVFPTSPTAGQLHPIIDPPPRTRPAFQLLAFALIIAFACLQFLPATHLRDPEDPLRSWIPVDSARSLDKSGTTSTKSAMFESVHVVSWIDCLDLQVLAVLVNSTLTSSRSPKNVNFHFFIPENEEERTPFYMLKILFPDSNIAIIGQKEIKEKILRSVPEGEQLWSLLPELAPFIISSTNPSLRRFIYVSPFTIIKRSIEELFRADMGNYAIAVAEDCDMSLGDHVNIDIVNAIQRTAAKSWISKESYNENACMPDLHILLLDGDKLEKNIFEAIQWWNKVLNKNKSERINSISPSAALALYKRYLKLSTTWKHSESNASHDDANILHFDGPRRLCMENAERHQGSSSGNVWKQYLSSKSQLILSR